MEHVHTVHDSDARFVIDPVTRKIKSETNKKITLIQFDHNSERFTFEIPKVIEGHDMSKCNAVEVHYFNIDSVTKKSNSGIYMVDDLRIDPENPDAVVCSWLISKGATKLNGVLKFLLRYRCVNENDVETYAWNTAFFTGISISEGSDADEAFEQEYVDIIGQWKDSVLAGFEKEFNDWKYNTEMAVAVNIDNWKTEALKDVDEYIDEHSEQWTADLANANRTLGFLSNYVTPQMFGAKGDGVTDDTEAIQECFDYAHEHKLKVEFFKGTYIAYGLRLNSGVSINGNGAILKKPNLSVDPYNMTVEQMKWVRLLSVSHSSDVDSEITSIKNFELDGNCWEMWEVADGYAQEQASLFILSGDGAKKGKLNVSVENCFFHDCSSDGIHVVENVNATIKNCKSLDCFRGGLTITGGNTIINVDGFEFNSDKTNDGIDIEVDSLGYLDTKDIIVNLSNITIDKDLDVGVPEGSCVNIDNLIMKKGGYTLLSGGNLTIKNSVLIMDEVNYTGNMANMVYICKDANMIFENVVFDGHGTSKASCQTMFYENEKIKIDFINCRFTNGTWGISGSSTNRDAKMTVMNCTFETTNGFGGDCGNVSMVVPLVKLLNNVFDVENIAIKCIATNIYPSTLEMSGNTMKKCTSSMNIHAPTLIIHDEVWGAGLAIKYSNGHSNAKYFGKRTNIVESDPNGTVGIEGKHFEDYATDGTNIWKFKSGTIWELV